MTTLSESMGLSGTKKEEVIKAIRERYFKRKLGDFSPDGRRIGLVLEGGGMRCASSAGGALALGHLGLAEVFDDVYATSASVMNASYFMSKQEDLGISIYFDDLTSGKFCNLKRFWKILDVDYVIKDVVNGSKPLLVSRVKESPTRLHVSVMDRYTGEAIMINTDLTENNLTKMLHAALAIPVFYNRTIEINGRPCMDGGLLIPFPLNQAIADGCTDILVLLSHPADYIAQPPKWWQKLIFNLLCARGRTSTYNAYINAHKISNEYRELAFGRLPTNQRVNIATISTAGPPYLSILTMDRSQLMAAACVYGKRTIEALGADSSNWNLGPSSEAKWLDLFNL